MNGDDLLALGLLGRRVGRTLEALLNRVMEDELPNEREALLDAAVDINGLAPRPKTPRKRRKRRRRKPSNANQSAPPTPAEANQEPAPTEANQPPETPPETLPEPL